jgi:hypothetical protein
MQIPSGVRQLLWEYALDDQSIDAGWQNTILERVMQRGGWSEMQWLLQTFGRERLHTFLSRRGRRVLAPRELRYWAFICGVPSQEQDDWVAAARRREQAWRG